MPDGHDVPHPALAYHAPFVIEKLVKDHVANDVDEAEELFREVLRYLVLADTDRSTVWQMFSTRVDEAWHQFILFTVEYTEFCDRFFGGYRHHAPGNAPTPVEAAPAATMPESTFDQFEKRYAELFGVPLPTVWRDGQTITLSRRLVNCHLGTLTLAAGAEMLDLIDSGGRVVFEVNEPGHDALRFIVSHGAFFVREIPGELTDQEKLALASHLVECRILRVAA